MPAQINLKIWKGNSASIPIRFLNVVDDVNEPVDLTGSIIVFRASWSGGSVRRATDDPDRPLAMDAPTTGEIVINLTPEETRSMPAGSVVRYEIERRIGANQTTILYGFLNVSEWANDD